MTTLAVLCFLAILWIIITVVGHVSWLAIEFLIMGAKTPAQPAGRPYDLKRDLEATDRVLTRLVGTGLLQLEEATQVRVQLGSLAERQGIRKKKPSSKPSVSEGSEQTQWNTPGQDAPQSSPLTHRAPQTHRASQTHGAPQAHGASRTRGPSGSPNEANEAAESSRLTQRRRENARRTPEQPTPDHAASVTASHQPPVASRSAEASMTRGDQEKLTAEPRNLPRVTEGRAPHAQVDHDAKNTHPPQPTLSSSEIIRSFLAAHNIRWGELVAGLLIVVCSIGLVVSLWNTLVSQHRVVPSLIFLAANTAIFGAGLYTLSRWKLRHTSRAMLVIATLLVPLGILAGLAGAGTDAAAVSLTDPVTVVSILVVGAAYCTLLWWGGKALVGRRDAGPLCLAVAGPAVMLPLVPEMIRSFQSSVVWTVVGGSIALMAGLVWSVRGTYRRKATVLGVATGRHRILIIALGCFSLAALVGNLMYLTADTPNRLLSISLSLIPALSAVAATARTLSGWSKRPNLALAASVISVTAFGAIAVMLPASLVTAHWLWFWAVITSASLLMVGSAIRVPRMLALAALPLGITTVLTASTWTGAMAWDEMWLWQRMIGGQPMLAAFGVGAAIAVVGMLFSKTSNRRTLLFLSGGFIILGAINAMVLSVAPTEWLGLVPPWAVTALLAAAAIGCAVSPAVVAESDAERKHSLGELIACGSLPLIVMTWCSILHPVAIGYPLAPAKIWIATLLVIATSGMVATESLKRWYSSWLANLFHGGVAFVCFVAVVLSATLINSQWSVACYAFFAVAALLLWGASLRRDVAWLWAAQLTTLLAALVIGWGRFRDPLLSQVSWETANAPFAWSVLFSAVVVAWLLLRELSRLGQAIGKSENRLTWFHRSSVSPLRMMEGVVISAAMVMLSLAAMEGFGAMLFSAAGSDALQFYAPVRYAFTGFAAAGVMLLFARRHLGQVFVPLTMSYAVGGVIWIANQTAVRMLTLPNEQLVLSATTAMLGCGLLAWATKEKSASLIARLATAGLLIASSCVLLSAGWLHPILREVRPDTFSTVTVALWCAMGSVACGYFGNRLASSNYFAGSAVLAAMTTFLIMPLLQQGAIVAWSQWTVITVFGWTALSRWLFHSRPEARAVVRGTLGFALFSGLASGTITTAAGLLGSEMVHDFAASGGMLLTGMTAGLLLTPIAGRQLNIESETKAFSWPMILTLFAGHLSVLLSSAVGTGLSVAKLTIVCWMVAMAGSTIRYLINRSQSLEKFVHAAVMSVVIAFIAFAHSGIVFYQWCGFLAAVCLGILVIPLAWKTGVDEKAEKTAASPMVLATSARMLSWFMLATGGYFLLQLCSAAFSPQWETWTVVLTWLGTWIVVWRVAAADARNADDASWLSLSSRVLPDTEITFLFTIAILGELLVSLPLSDSVSRLPGWQTPWFCVRLCVAIAIVVTTSFRARRTTAWCLSSTLACLASSILAVRIADANGADMVESTVIAILTGTSILTMIAFASRGLALGSGLIASHWVRSIVAWMPKGLPSSDMTLRSFQPDASHSCSVSTAASGIWLSAVGGILATIASCIAVVVFDNSQPLLPLMIGGVALLAVAATELSGIGQPATREHRRRTAVILAFFATFLLASVGVVETNFPMLTLTMRWFVAGVCTIGVFAFALPKMMGERQAAVWRESFRGGRKAAGLIAITSLIMTLGQEALIRSGGDPNLISKPLVLGVAATLAILSLLTTLGAVLSGPQSSYQKQWQLSDTTRRALVVLAQVFGGLTWFHLFLCKNPLASLGLRAYWPYVVMTLAFASVAITQWANRRGDRLIADTMRQTSLYLPLVPVLGFWLSLSLFEVGVETNVAQNAWTYIQGKVSYQSLLIIGTLYYAGISTLWKNGISRVATVILGNAALWIVLAQTPNWAFLSHPQAWLIPPAASVLVVAHLHRQRLGKEASSAIRYAATLVIYISSTADMLLNDIGSTLAGPMILITLALAGMAAGVVLKVKPFLYLGAIFVFFGVTSMVWHAQKSMDEVWPWWAFGISTGLLLLVGLMAIEKNKPRLQAMASRLATWEA